MAIQHAESIPSLQRLTQFEENITAAKRDLIIAQEDYKYVKQKERLVREFAVASVKESKLKELSTAQQEHMETIK
jgi:ABC-type lipopolysaccharide export system ATPase subunit